MARPGPFQLARRLGRRMLAAVPGEPMAMQVRAGHDVEDLGDGRWASTGYDPQFLLEPPPGRRLPTDWVRVQIELRPAADEMLEPQLYVDIGRGRFEHTPVNLPAPEAGRIDWLVRLPTRVEHLRLDPCRLPGEFVLGRVQLGEMTETEAVAWLGARAMGQAAGVRDALGMGLRGLRQLRKGGLSGVAAHAALQAAVRHSYQDGEIFGGLGQEHYAEWAEVHDSLDASDLRAMRRRLARLRKPPLISILMPVYNPEGRWLRAALDSALAQVHERWELCIADDASTEPHVRAILDEYARKDRRIRVTYRPENGHIARASNTALEMATGDFVALLDHDDLLRPHSLYMVVEWLQRHPDAQVLYSDEDKIDGNGKRSEPTFKPDWNPELMRGYNVISHLGVYRRALLEKLGGFRPSFEGAQDYDLALRATDEVAASQIVHIPHVLYHWRVSDDSTASDSSQKPYAARASERALAEHLRRNDVSATLGSIRDHATWHRVRYDLPADPPLVSLIIPTRDAVELLEQAVSSILDKTRYPRYEILIVDNDSREKATRTYLDRVSADARVRVIPYPDPFNFSAINNFAATRANGEVLGLINNDIEVISDGWLTELVSRALQPGAGCVGAMLYYPDDRIQHAGVICGPGGVAGHAHKYFPRGSPGYGGRAMLAQNLSVVTAACLVIRKSVYQEVDGLDEKLQVAFNDVDFCLRVREAGYWNAWTPFAELYHHESATRGSDQTDGDKAKRFQEEVLFMQDRWKDTLLNDPAYNPNLTVLTEDFALAVPPRAPRPWARD